jgi:hypothetical protein
MIETMSMIQRAQWTCLLYGKHRAILTPERPLGNSKVTLIYHTLDSQTQQNPGNSKRGFSCSSRPSERVAPLHHVSCYALQDFGNDERGRCKCDSDSCPSISLGRSIERFQMGNVAADLGLARARQLMLGARAWDGSRYLCTGNQAPPSQGGGGRGVSLIQVDDSSGCDERKEAQTWLFKSCVCLKEGQTFSNLLDARKKQMNISRFGNSDFMGMHKQCS